MSPIEPYAISLDRAFSTAAHSYATTVDSTIEGEDKAMLPAKLSTANFKWVKDGDTIDLGGNEAIEVPGHSTGSIVFLDAKAKVFAVGDALGSGSYVRMFIPNTPALDVYRDSLKRLEAKLAGYDTLTFLGGQAVGDRHEDNLGQSPERGGASDRRPRRLIAGVNCCSEGPVYPSYRPA